MRIHHIALRTRDLAGLVRFYTDALGLAVVKRSGDAGVWLQADDALVMIERADEGEPAIPSGTRELLAFAVEAGELPSFEKRLAGEGVPIEARTQYTLYFRDPDGRRVGVSQYPHP
jgi:catechol 2,3-dioxygenase-like lactoylglutathione lyase family enzyme